MLELPHLGNAPRVLRIPGSQIASARTALALLDTDLVPEKSAGDIGALINRALKQWLHQHTGTMKTMRVRLSYDEANDEAGITLAVDMAAPLCVGERLTLLQNHIDGLGQTVLWHLSCDLPAPLEIITPSDTLEFAMYTQWGGCEDETEQVAMLIAEGEKKEDINILTRAEFYKQIPRWATEPEERQKPKALDNIARHWKKPRLVKDVAAAVLALHECRAAPFQGREDGVRVLPPAQLLTWRKNDTISARLFDDFANMLWESGETTEDFAELHLRGSTGQWSTDLAAFMATIEPMLRTLRAADRVLQLIGGRSRG